jgi:hypothetical protein
MTDRLYAPHQRTRGALMWAPLCVAAACLLAPPPAAAHAVPDASCPGPSDTFTFVTGTWRFAQTFTAQNTGRLTQAQLGEITKAGSAGDYVVSLNAVDGAATPTNTVLASTTIPDASVPPGVSTITADFASPAEVVAGQIYAVVITRPGSDSLRIGVRSGDPCSGAYFQAPDQTTVFSTPCGGSCDLIFATFVEPPPGPEPPPAPKADGTLTIDANKGKVEKGRKVTLTGQLDVPSNESCEPGRQIQIQRRLKSQDDSKFTTFKTVTTDTTGNFSTKEKVKKTYFYRAVITETNACDDETSNSQKVRVQKKKAAQEA